MALKQDLPASQEKEALILQQAIFQVVLGACFLVAFA